MARCPTYGSCTYCVQSALVGQLCSKCDIPEAGYIIMTDGPYKATKIIDAITLAQLYGLGHEVPKLIGYLP